MAKAPARPRYRYHASAYALKGRITRPLEIEIEPQAASFLPHRGGYAFKQKEAFRVREIVSFAHAHSQVIGSETPDAFESSASAVIEGLNILDVITAGLVIARITCVHPKQDGCPSDLQEPYIIPLGSEFVNLRIAGRPVHVHVNVETYCEHPTYSALHSQSSDDPSLWKRLSRSLRSVPLGAKGDPIHCHAASDVRCDIPGVTIEGNAITVANFGKIFLAELELKPRERSITMLRAELGSPLGGQIAVGGGVGNGHPYP